MKIYLNSHAVTVDDGDITLKPCSPTGGLVLYFNLEDNNSTGSNDRIFFLSENGKNYGYLVKPGEDFGYPKSSNEIKFPLIFTSDGDGYVYESSLQKLIHDLKEQIILSKKATQASCSFFKSKLLNDFDPGDFDEDLLHKLFYFLIQNNRQPNNGWYKRIASFKYNNLPEDTWLERITKIVEYTKTHRSVPMTLEFQQILYGDELGIEKWKAYCEKQSKSNTFEYKKEMHGWNKQRFDDYNKSRATTLESMIQRYGDEEGSLRWKHYCQRQGYTNTLDYFIEREGSVEKGTEKYLEINQNKNSCDPHVISKKYNIPFDDAVELIKDRKSSGNFVSELEKSFVDCLSTLVGVIPYTYKTKQFGHWSHRHNCYYFYDIVDTTKKKVIEFYGDYWHANPKLYESTYFNQKIGKTSKEIWEHDQQKIQELTNLGYNVQIVWEQDYINDPNLITKIVEWWND